MSGPTNQPPDPGATDPVVGRPGRKRWQVGLRTMFLITAAIAVWITFSINRRENAVLESRIAAMRPLARELIIDDAKKIAVVKLDELWMDENQWEIYLPDGTYQLCVATRGIDVEGLAPAVKSAPVAAGRHRVGMDQSLDNEVRRVAVTLDGTKLLEAVEPKEWNSGSGSSGGGEYSVSTQLPADEPAVLFRRQFLRPDTKGRFSTHSGPTDGILMWIERAGSTKPQAIPPRLNREK